ncbi:uncharacterized protein LOC118738495 isoform X1 [Rhagoletis pomonella]|uniref:uncharacterized protein LOC118738495 isoform X1 n=1 Tax=Rhagoletis pomonella TaxID=28610 RepID=UPI00177BC2B8|nr:uncharacterized protein LOC118738495 isoform X1 [Rhagoletis pomonella]
MGQWSLLAILLLTGYFYVICSAKSLEQSDYQADLFTGFKSKQPHKRYQSNEASEYNAIEGKGDNADVFDEMQADVYENLVRLVKVISEMQKERERVSIRYKPNLGKRTQMYK